MEEMRRSHYESGSHYEAGEECPKCGKDIWVITLYRATKKCAECGEEIQRKRFGGPPILEGISIGDVVCLKSGSDTMTVESFNEDGFATCVWFHSVIIPTEQPGFLQRRWAVEPLREMFNPATLEKCELPQAVDVELSANDTRGPITRSIEECEDDS